MAATYYQRGEALDYTNTGAETIEAGTVIKYGARIGIAESDILPGELGVIHVAGVFEMPKKDTTKIDAGAEVYWNPAEGAEGITATAGALTKAGFAVAEAAAEAVTVLVKINA